MISRILYYAAGRPELSLIKSAAFVITTPRGNIIAEETLAQALSDRQIAGAGLDVFANEPKVHPDRDEHVTLLPHIGSATSETRFKMAWLAAENLIAFTKDSAPNLVNPQVLESQ